MKGKVCEIMQNNLKAYFDIDINASEARCMICVQDDIFHCKERVSKLLNRRHPDRK